MTASWDGPTGPGLVAVFRGLAELALVLVAVLVVVFLVSVFFAAGF